MTRKRKRKEDDKNNEDEDEEEEKNKREAELKLSQLTVEKPFNLDDVRFKLTYPQLLKLTIHVINVKRTRDVFRSTRVLHSNCLPFFFEGLELANEKVGG